MIHSIKTYQWMIPLFKLRYCKHWEVSEHSENLTDILARHPHLMFIMSHGPTLAPLASIPALLDLMMQAGGGERKNLAIIWRPLYKIPLLKNFAAYVTNTTAALSMPDCLKHYREGFNDIMLMPEGDFCLFGNGKDIEKFISPKFIELALNMNAPILIAAHQGTAAWGRALPIPKLLLPLFKSLPAGHFEQLNKNQRLNIPRFPWRLKNLCFNFKLYQPSLTLAEFKKIKNGKLQKQRLIQEAEKIQQIMQGMVEKLSS